MRISVSQMRRVDWEVAFENGTRGEVGSFRVFINPVAPLLTLTYLQEEGKIRTIYRAFGQPSDTLDGAVRLYNAEEARRRGRHAPPGSVESIRENRRRE